MIVSVVANDSDQNLVVVTVGLCGSLMITLSVPRGGSLCVSVVKYLPDQNCVVIIVGLGYGISQ